MSTFLSQRWYSEVSNSGVSTPIYLGTKIQPPQPYLILHDYWNLPLWIKELWFFFLFLQKLLKMMKILQSQSVLTQSGAISCSSFSKTQHFNRCKISLHEYFILHFYSFFKLCLPPRLINAPRVLDTSEYFSGTITITTH